MSTHRPFHTPIATPQSTQPFAFPAGGVFSGWNAPPVNPMRSPHTPAPPRTPAAAAAANIMATPAAHIPNGKIKAEPIFQTPQQPYSSFQFAQTPIKSTPFSAAPPAFATPSVSVTPAPISTPAPAQQNSNGGQSSLSSMSEAESAKLMAALNQFVLTALQQQTNSWNGATASGQKAPLSDAKNYATLLSQLQATHTDPLALSRWYAAINKSVSSLHAVHHATLLEMLYNFSYTEAASLRNVEMLVQLLVSMCVGGNQIHALGPVLKTLVSSFIATNVPMATISAASVSPALYGRPGDVSQLPSMSLGESATGSAGLQSIIPAGGSELPTMDAIHDIVHSALTRLIQLLPSSPTVLFPLLVEKFPHKRLDVTLQLVYVKNLLRVSEYAASLRDRILTTIIERMIHIDVEIIHAGDEFDELAADAEEEDEEDENDNLDEELPNGEPDLMFAMSNGNGSQTTAPVSKRLAESRAMANKLDSLMCLMFEYLNLIRIAGNQQSNKPLASPQTPGALIANATANGTNSTGNGSANGPTAAGGGDLCDEVFSSLLRVFERSILRTHNSRFLQFLLFYYCSFKHVYAETFLKYLMEKGFEVQTSGVERQNAALYIASFVARASFLRHASAIVAFEMLLKWTHAYTEYHIKTSQAALVAAAANSYNKHSSGASANQQVPEVGPLEASQHAVFYRMCQAVFYIFCYRQDSFKDMLESNPEILAQLKFDTLIFSPLNPLRYISTGVIDEFLKVNAHLGTIVQCDQLVERNYRLNQSSMLDSHAHNGSASSAHKPRVQAQGSNGNTAGGVIGSEGSNTGNQRFDPNDIFFPFDPYQLKHSSAYIDNLYILYPDEEDDDNDEEYADDDEEERDGEENEDENEEDDDDEEQSHMDDDSRPSRSVAMPVKVSSKNSNGTKSKPIPRAHRNGSQVTDSPELESALSDVSASFSSRLSVDESSGRSVPMGSSFINGSSSSAADMSWQAETGTFLPPPVLTDKAVKKAKKAKKEKKLKKADRKGSSNSLSSRKSARKNSKASTDSSSDDDDDYIGGTAVVLSAHDLSFSPDSPSFPSLDDSPQIKGKNNRR